MIDIKIFGKAKDSARNGQGGSTGTSTVSVKEAAHASEADYAAKAGKADASTLAERAVIHCRSRGFVVEAICPIGFSWNGHIPCYVSLADRFALSVVAVLSRSSFAPLCR